jgi:tryptophanyl-tRNA synthetase
MQEVGPLQWGQFKPRLADALVEHLAPIRTNYAEVMKVRHALSLTVLDTDMWRGTACVWQSAEDLRAA